VAPLKKLFHFFVCLLFDIYDVPSICRAGLPEGIFSNQNSQFGEILEGLEKEDVGTLIAILYFNSQMGYFVAILYILG
jgi:hypothetical protein